jgi:ParB-like chromosome segregation protein Spo0J
MLKRETLPIAKIYVPVKRRATLKSEVVREIAESILEIGQQTPILVRCDGDRFVLVEGLHRLESELYHHPKAVRPDQIWSATQLLSLR